jgi:16S rRNA (cytosine967-C5)-methyltransferase
MPRRKTARDRAVDVLRAVLERGGRATPLLASAGRGLSAADQDLLRELVLGVLRWRAALDAEIAGTSRVPLEKLAPKLREILEVALYQIRRLERIPDYAAVSEAVSQARASGGEGAARLVNGVLRGILLLPPPAPPPLPAGEGGGEGLLGSSAHLAEAEELARHFSHPRFLVERWLARFGPAGTRRILEADNAPSPVDLLANPRQAGRDALAEALRGERVETRSSPLSPLGLTVVRGNPMRTRLFEEGGFFVQDLGSQALPRLLPPGDTLVDLAAAPGGKSFASIFSGLARRSVAVDRSFDRLRLLAQNRKRLGVADIAAAAGDIGAPPLPATRFDRVLLDAPCSGTGTLRKSPEIRYRVTAAGIERLSAAQESWLEAAAALVAPGGYLLYATCSLEEEENERVVARVLERVPGLELAPIEPPEGLERFVSGPRFRLFPGADTDGFTAHLLRRAR